MANFKPNPCQSATLAAWGRDPARRRRSSGGGVSRGGRGRGSPAAAARALGEVVGEGLSLVDRRLLGLRVVRVDLSRRGVTSGLAAAEALSAVLHLRRHEAGRALRHPPSVRQRHRYVEEAPRRRVAFDLS